MILRYTKANDVVFDPFCGSGTTAFESESLKRNFIDIDVQQNLVDEVKLKLDSKHNFFEIFQGNSAHPEVIKSVKERLNKYNRSCCQLAILHPLYHNIISFSNHPEDLSNIKDLNYFLQEFRKCIINSITVLQKYRYLIIVIGDKYTQGQWIPLGFYCMNEAIKNRFTIKERNNKKYGR